MFPCRYPKSLKIGASVDISMVNALLLTFVIWFAELAYLCITMA